jgi:hypothetical protein
MRGWRGAAVVVMLALVAPAGAAPLTRAEVPEPLRPWIDWALRGHDEERCPFLGTPAARQCAWPSRLALVLDDRGGRFTQQWLVSREGDVPLPGDASAWPQQVWLGDRPGTVTMRDGRPVVHLDAGSHTITGAFEWAGLPEILAVPPATGLVALTLGAEPIVFPRRDAQGRLWLRARAAEPDAEARLDLTVVRHVRDDVPLVLTTQIELKVSGRSREVVLAKALPDGFVPLGLAGPLPARLEPDGHLRVQLRPGSWTLTVTGRHEGRAASLTLPEPDGLWAREEVWAFEAAPALRLVTVEGAESVDPSQTMLPGAWRRLPAYRLHPGDTMRLVETRRGDADPAPDRLALERTWWLDFDGGGYTVHDRVTGTMAAEWRLEMAAPMVLGRTAVGGVDQPITRRGADGPMGVEVRQREVQIDADARLDAHVRRVPAVGWLHDFAAVSGTLNLPPGWRLLHARGVDLASPTWVERWTLLDLFVVLVIAMAAFQLYGLAWGMLALAGLTLSYLEPGAPRWAWLAFLAVEGLVRALPAVWARRAAKALRLALLVGLVAIAAPYVLREARLAMHPALEQAVAGPIKEGLVAATAPAAAGEEKAERLLSRKAYQLADAMEPMRRYEIDPSIRVQTGPGRPEWVWNRVALRWQGPVERTQRLDLLLVPPWMSRLLGVLRVALVVLLVLRLARGLRVAPLASSAALCLLLGASLAGTARAELPSRELLDELRSRLLEPPACLPACVGVNRLALDAGGDRLRLRLDVDAAADSGLALPGSAQDWTPTSVLLDGRPATGLARTSDGRLWLALAPGRHDVLLDGPLPARDVVRVPLPEPPRRTTATLAGWTLDGLREDGVTDENLQLTRIRTGGRDGATLEPGTLPPFARIVRTLRLGLTWDVETQVERLSPADTAVVLDVPLLEGEAVTDGDARPAAGRAIVSLAPQAVEARWQSVLSQGAAIALAAPASASWVEVWRLDVGPMWHAEVDGIPVVQPGAEPARTREWRPWPGEAVTVRVARPGGVPGPTLTIDRTLLVVRPGLRATDGTLALTVRSSQGGRHRVTLPDGAALEGVSVDGQTQPIRQDGDGVTLPIVPGTQRLELTWRVGAGGITGRFASPAVDVGAPSANAELQIAVPANRWILAVGGPRVGPAVLFWSTLVVVAIGAAVLGRIRLTPLRTRHWLLLGLGLTQVDAWVALVIAGWFLALGWRRREPDVGDGWFNLRQLALVPWTVAVLILLFRSIQQGLLGLPEMQIAGNDSTAALLRWYQDRSGPALPQAWVLSVPLLVYRGAMLAWALWIATALIRWLRWAWDCYGEGGLWRPIRRRTVAERAS